MADDRKVLMGVRLPGKKDERERYNKGTVITDPDELEKAAAAKDSRIDLQALYDAGAISGTWKGVKVAKEEKAEKK